MKRESPIREVYNALELASLDLYGFAVVCQGGGAWSADPIVLDTLLLGLENHWFSDFEGNYSHEEYREDFFRLLWKKSKGNMPIPKIGSDVPMGHEEMRFYQLPQFSRALLYLRTKKTFSYASLSLIFEVPAPILEEEVEKSREFLLGKRIKLPDWTEEDF